MDEIDRMPAPATAYHANPASPQDGCGACKPIFGVFIASPTSDLLINGTILPSIKSRSCVCPNSSLSSSITCMPREIPARASVDGQAHEALQPRLGPQGLAWHCRMRRLRAAHNTLGREDFLQVHSKKDLRATVIKPALHDETVCAGD